MSMAMAKRLYTYGDYVQWPENVQVELVDEFVYVMSPAPSLPTYSGAL